MHLQRHSLKLAGIETWVSQICLPLPSSVPLCFNLFTTARTLNLGSSAEFAGPPVLGYRSLGAQARDTLI